MESIKVDDVSVRLNGKPILTHITFSIEEGEFWGIIGPNGGGKTTLLKTILGVIQPQSGKVTVFGLPPRKAVKKGWIGYLPQRMNSGRFPVTALEVTMLGECDRGNFFKPSNKLERERAIKSIELVGMREKAHQPFSQLSGGEQQRVLIAMALASNPRILLLDEPNTGVDVVAQEGFYQVLKRLKKELSITILMVSHDVGVIANFVDKIACLNVGLHFSGDPWAALNCHLLEGLYGAPVEIFIHHPECDGCHIFRTKGKHE